LMNWASIFLKARFPLHELLHCSSFIVLFRVASTMLCHTALARQAAPAAGLKLGLLFHGSPPWPVVVGRCPLVRRLRGGATRAADPCRFRLVSRSHTRAGSLRVQHVARCGPRAVHAAHVRAQCHANGHTRVGVSGWVSRLGHSRHVSAHAHGHGHPPTRE
jgi:hypothetical protein